MPFGTWEREERLPDLSSLPEFSARISTDVALLARLVNISTLEVERRLETGSRAYLAFWDGVPVAYGWIAEREGRINDLRFSFKVSAPNGYLWDFQTLPQWRGCGIYPRLIQAIVREEAAFERFWIGYAPGNEASARGIKKAGFRIVGDYVVVAGRVVGVTLYDETYARLTADFFDLPIISGE